MAEPSPPAPRGRPPVIYTDDEIRTILQGVADGLNYAAIGRRLNPLRPVSYEAVKSRCYGLRREWGALNMAHLVSLAYQRGWLTVDTPCGTVGTPGAGATVLAATGRYPRPPGHTTAKGAI